MKILGKTAAVLSLIALVALIARTASAGGLNKEWVPATAKWVVHLDVERLLKSEIGGYLIEPASNSQVQAKLEIARKLVGIDPLKDIASITLYGMQPSDRDVVAIVRGKLDPAAVETFLKANEEYEAVPCGNRIAHKWVDKNKGNRGYACFPAEGVAMVAASIERLQSAVDLLDGKGEPMSRSTALPPLQGPADAIMVAAGVKVNETVAGKNGANPSLFQNTDSISLAISETAGIVELVMNVGVTTSENAAQVEQLIKGMIAFAVLSKDQNPGLSALAQNCSVETRDSSITVKLTHPAKAIGEIIRQIRQKKPVVDNTAVQSETPADAVPAER